MTHEDKQLLLKDLCGMLPYKIKVNVPRNGSILTVYSIIDFNKVYLKVDDEALRGWSEEVEEVKPYLRPMSSMTEEERKHFESKCCWGKWESGPIITLEAADWLNENHLDYRGLIEKGLALEAPEGMYKTE